MTWPRFIMGCLISGAIGAASTAYLVRNKPVTAVQTETTKNTQTVTKRTKQPDGTVITERVTQQVEESHSQSVTVAPPKYNMQLGYDSKQRYFGSISKQFIGHIGLGIQLQSDGAIGLLVGIQF